MILSGVVCRLQGRTGRVGRAISLLWDVCRFSFTHAAAGACTVHTFGAGFWCTYMYVCSLLVFMWFLLCTPFFLSVSLSRGKRACAFCWSVSL